MMTSFYYYDQNPSAVCILVQTRAFVIKPRWDYKILIRKTKKDSGRRSKMSPSCKWPILSGYVLQYYKNGDFGPVSVMEQRCLNPRGGGYSRFEVTGRG